jgi:RHS repeat-associated protein
MKRLALVLFMWLAQATPLAAQAQSAPTRCNPAMQCCRQANLPGDPGCAGGGNPINLITGNKYQQEVDLAPLPGVQGVEIVRRYNSASALDSHPNRANGLLGKGWRLSYEIELGADGEHQRTLTLADGSTIGFTRGVLQPTHFIAADLGQGRLVEQGDGTEWQRLDGQRFSFNTQGRLVQIHAATGEFTSLAHDGQGRLIKVTDPQGRSLVLHYADAKSATRYRGVSAIDTPVGRFEYSYGSHAGAANLMRVALPGNVQRNYHYEDPRHASALTGIGIQDDKGAEQRLSTYLYDAQGLAVLSVKGLPAKLQTDAGGRASKPYRLQDGSGVEQVIVERGNDGVTVLNSLNQKSQAKWAEIAGQRLITEFTGAGCAHCPPPNTRWAYDKQGRLSETTQLDANGRALQSERHELDAWGRVKATYRVSHVNSPARTELIARYEYAAPFAEGASDATQPTLIARPSVVPGKEHQTRIAYNAHGQPTAITEAGFSPIDDKGEAHATPIARTTTYAYGRINGRSVLTQIDGPLANGPKNTPEDSDITTMQWDERSSAVTAIVQPGGFKSQTQYDNAGRLAQVRNDQGQTSRFGYDPSGQLAQLQRQGQGGFTQTQTFTYDARSNPTETRTNSYGQPTSAMAQGFDAAGRPLWRATALGTLEQRRYDTESRVIEALRTTNAITQSVRYHYAHDGQLAGMSDNAGRHTSVLFDKASSQSAAVVDSLGRVQGHISGHAALNSKQLIDDFGRNVLTRSPDSGITARRFDEADRLISMTDALRNEARYDYDLQGRIVRQSAHAANAEPLITRWRYEGHRLVQLDHPTQSERYEYDANGWRAARIVIVPTAKGELTAITRYERDEQGRLIASTLPDGSRLVHERNGQGQVIALKRNQVITPWLRRFETPQVIVKNLERDLIGLRKAVAGNGVESLSLRSKEGTLARTVHRAPVKPPKPMTALRDDKPWREQVSSATALAFEALMGVRSAHATPAPALALALAPTEPTQPARPDESKGQPELPGALGHPDDPQAFIDHRYLWDASGNLRLDQQRVAAQEAAYAYDTQDRLIVAQMQAAQAVQAVQHQPVRTDTARPQLTLHRYFHDARGRRVLAQEDAGDTHKTAYETNTHRAITGDAQYDATGRPRQQGQHRYTWDAYGRLIKLSQGDRASEYTYDHRGLRNTKTTHGNTTHYLQDESHQLIAELNAQGRITRQYVYLADMPVAVIDSEGAALAATTKLQVLQDLAVIVKTWLGRADDHITWLHSNHLDAPEAATDAKAQVVWQASYAPYGKTTVKTTGFTLHLRLPGQYEDAETGLHYNRQRYYDPAQGRYLTPDPLGTPDGPDGYAYVNYNPLRYVDPDGLVLFAFDGTDNTDDEAWLRRRGSSLTNVVHFRNAYDDGNARYITGVGTDHRDGRYADIVSANYDVNVLVDTITDRAGNYSGPDRIARMELYMIEEAQRETNDQQAMDIDIIGFSRGAAQARDFANRLVRSTSNGFYRYDRMINGQRVTGCQRVNFRFMGLWDTVLSENRTGHTYQLGIPPQFSYVAQAVALNEYRSRIGSVLSDIPFWNATRNPQDARNHYGYFPLESISGSGTPQGATRIELGFVGAHADIGGGYGENDNQLSRVALSWMVAQAQIAGVRMRADQVPVIDMDNPVIHDPSNAIRWGNPLTAAAAADDRGTMRTPEDRQVNGACNPATPGGRCQGGPTTQRQMQFTFGNGVSDNRSMVNADTHQFIRYTARDPNNVNTIRPLRQSTGTVNMQEYLSWLRNHGYVFNGDY